jgi:hypothetical protein
MPVSKRDLLRRALAQAWGHLDEAMEDLLNLAEIFRPHHPDMAEALSKYAEVCLGLQEELKFFALAAWGRAPETREDWDRWRTGSPGFKRKAQEVEK